MSLSGNTEKINELLSKINALPEAGSGGGSSGGASVETCTVVINSTSPITNVVAMVLADGSFGITEGGDGDTSCTFENVVKGSIIVFRTPSKSISFENATLYKQIHYDDFAMVYVFAAVAG